MNKLAVFDFDSTLMDGETIEIIASEIGLQEQVAQITKRAMEGELDFFDSLTYRVSLLKGISEKRVNEICHSLPYMPGAKETITALKNKGYTVVCFSGGFKNATEYAKNILGYDADFSNILHTKDGTLTGQVGGEMMFSDSKGQMLQKLQTILKVTPENTITVGDGANDLSMFKYAKTRVAFCAKQCLKEASTICLEEKDLRSLLEKIN
ncbi:MAG: phosphoserine phosphatase SerB [Candidatus Gastranaerophilaceae bacterium]|jgi:phosphoserine phosphatase serB